MDSTSSFLQTPIRVDVSNARACIRPRLVSILLSLALPFLAWHGGVQAEACVGCAESSAWQHVEPSNDFLAIQDETLWVLLMEEPSLYMQRANVSVPMQN